MSDLRIPPLDVRPDTIVAMGVSSGSFMSSLMFLTDPDLFKGIGAGIGGTPHWDKKYRLEGFSKPPDVDIDEYMKGL